LFELRSFAQNTVQQVTDQLHQHNFNVVVALLMKYSNRLSDLSQQYASAIHTTPEYHQALQLLVQMLSPLAPHISAELYEALVQHAQPAIKAGDRLLDVHQQAWPTPSSYSLLAPSNASASLASSQPTTLVVQVAGKMRGEVVIEATGNHEALDVTQHARIEKLLRESEAVGRLLQGKAIRKLICVPHKSAARTFVVNLVLADA